MNNTSIILFHKIQWFLTENEANKLEDFWEQSIKKFIYNGFKEGEFEVEYKSETDSLRWFIDLSK